MNKRIFDGVFILGSAAVLVVLQETIGLEKYIPFALIPILAAYFLGQYAERKFKK
jgi:hypothetical protein